MPRLPANLSPAHVQQIMQHLIKQKTQQAQQQQGGRLMHPQGPGIPPRPLPPIVPGITPGSKPSLPPLVAPSGLTLQHRNPATQAAAVALSGAIRVSSGVNYQGPTPASRAIGVRQMNSGARAGQWEAKQGFPSASGSGGGSQRNNLFAAVSFASIAFYSSPTLLQCPCLIDTR
jgi:hypothetical protein